MTSHTQKPTKYKQYLNRVTDFFYSFLNVINIFVTGVLTDTDVTDQ